MAKRKGQAPHFPWFLLELPPLFRFLGWERKLQRGASPDPRRTEEIAATVDKGAVRGTGTGAETERPVVTDSAPLLPFFAGAEDR